MNGTSLIAVANVAYNPGAHGTRSQRRFNGDGKADIPVAEPRWRVAVWLMAPEDPVGRPMSFQSAGLACHRRGDSTADGKADILGRTTTARPVWLMNGTGLIRRRNFAPIRGRPGMCRRRRPSMLRKATFSGRTTKRQSCDLADGRRPAIQWARKSGQYGAAWQVHDAADSMAAEADILCQNQTARGGV